MKQNKKYNKALQSIPSPGGGGCHPALLGVANHGVMAGLTDERMFTDIRNSIPDGDRPVPDNEIDAAIRRARQDLTGVTSTGGRPSVPHKPRPVIKSAYLQHLLKQGKGISEQDLRAVSPVQLLEVPKYDAHFILQVLFNPEDILFLGGRYDTGLRPAKDWIDHIHGHGTSGLPHIIPNPLTGNLGEKKGGGLSFRCDAAVKAFCYTVVEFDNLSKEDQLAFWAVVPLPVAALIDSGGKSIHGWIRTDGITDAQAWTEKIETELYARRLIPMGVDPACKNESRLSRLPGHYRAEKERYQKLLYLNPHPAPIPIFGDKKLAAIHRRASQA
ncbi:hypothetical protein [Pontiella sulfatireligans]|uniref:Uncharacterized protein n=1 Tax=Pontiella sulfatireligans TaxID=2750658 RepID=A0A6C2UGZ8_9BACT|nr:hypothetical protein [Pontiella sulfatireligans]VGO18787.1 hypothetical protein SCARR_00840 [Pontiella sulfatireligans]